MVEVRVNRLLIRVIISKGGVNLRQCQIRLSGDLLGIVPKPVQPAIRITLTEVPETRGRPPQISDD